MHLFFPICDKFPRALRAHQIFCIGLDPWSSALVAYSSIRLKYQTFNIGHDYALWIRNFMVMMKKPIILILRLVSMVNGQNRAKEGNLSIKNSMLMINNHFSRFQLPGNLLKTKINVLPISVATRNFLLIYLFI
jgi:hypothetical protein